MLRRALAQHHFALFQTAVVLIGLVVCLHILCEYPWALCAGYSATGVAAYWVGQGLMGLVQRPRTRRPDSSLD